MCIVAAGIIAIEGGDMSRAYTLTKGDETHTFESEKEACEFIGAKQQSVSNAYCKNYKIRGYKIIRGESTSHCESNTRLYRIWSSMKHRCRGKNHEAYHNYGGRGIKVCDEWNKYKAFRKWALENGYSDELTLDRIDNNGNYEPSNCRWATMKQQCANKRTNHYVIVNGEKMIIAECSRKYGIPKSTIRMRDNNGADVLTGKKENK